MNMNLIDITNMTDSHLQALLAAAAERGENFDLVEDTKASAVVSVVGETDKAWKVSGLFFFHGLRVKSRGAALETAELVRWLPKSHCSLVVNGGDTLAIAPAWLMRKIGQELV